MSDNGTNQMEASRTQSWAVIGGGMMGMTVAQRLAKQGLSVQLFESAPELGGLTSAWQLGDVIWDRFYHVTLLSDTHLRDLLEEIGLEKEMKWVETKTGFYTDGELHSMSNTLEFLRFPPLRLIDKIRLGGTIFYVSKIRNFARMERILVETWLRRWSGNRVYEKIWQPLLRAKLGETHKKTSAAFIWAHTNRMYAARRTGLKKEMFGYVPGGYARIFDRMVEVLGEMGVTFNTGHAVSKITRDESTGKNRVEFKNGNVYEFDNVVLTIPSTAISHVCPDLQDDEKQLFDGVEYLGVVCASVLLKNPLTPYYVTNITDTWVPLTGIIEMSTIVDRDELGGNSLVYLPKYVPSADAMFDRSDEDIREEFISTLEKMYDHFSRDDVLEFKVGRARNVMALPTLEYSKRLPPVVTSHPGVFVVNSAQIVKGNLNVNETIQMADESLGKVLNSIANEPSEAEEKSEILKSKS